MKIKTTVGIALLACAAIATTIFVISANQPAPSSTALPTTPPASPTTGQPATITLSAAEVAKHNSANDCWMIINGKVYDLTSFLGVHPGGAYTMIPYCGADGSVGFATKDSQPPHNHSGGAAALLPSYLLGALNATITPKTAPANPTGSSYFGPGDN